MSLVKGTSKCLIVMHICMKFQGRISNYEEGLLAEIRWHFTFDLNCDLDLRQGIWKWYTTLSDILYLTPNLSLVQGTLKWQVIHHLMVNAYTVYMKFHGGISKFWRSLGWDKVIILHLKFNYDLDLGKETWKWYTTHALVVMLKVYKVSLVSWW